MINDQDSMAIGFLMDDFAVEVEDLVKTFGSFVAVDHIHFQVKKRRGLRISRTQRGREIHHDPNTLWSPDPHLWKREGGRI